MADTNRNDVTGNCKIPNISPRLLSATVGLHVALAVASVMGYKGVLWYFFLGVLSVLVGWMIHQIGVTRLLDKLAAKLKGLRGG